MTYMIGQPTLCEGMDTRTRRCMATGRAMVKGRNGLWTHTGECEYEHHERVRAYLSTGPCVYNANWPTTGPRCGTDLPKPWIAEKDPILSPDGWSEKFTTFAEAIHYADRRARQ